MTDAYVVLLGRTASYNVIKICMSLKREVCLGTSPFTVTVWSYVLEWQPHVNLHKNDPHEFRAVRKRYTDFKFGKEENTGTGSVLDIDKYPEFKLSVSGEKKWNQCVRGCNRARILNCTAQIERKQPIAYVTFSNRGKNLMLKIMKAWQATVVRSL